MAWNGSDGAGQPANGKANRPAGRKTSMTSQHKAQGVKHGLLAGLIIVALGCAALWFFTQDTGHKARTRDTPAQSTKHKAPAAITVATNAVAKNTPAPVAKPVEPELPPSERIVKESYTIITNGRGKIIERYRTADGKSHMVIGQVQPMFVEASDQLLAMMAGGSSDGTGSLPPMPGGVSNKDFKESLKKEIVINPDDSPAVIAAKERLKEIRENMLALVNDGAEFDDVIKQEQKIAEENEKIRLECQRELDKIVAEGDMEGAQKFQMQMSLALEQMGIAELKMPMTAEEKADLMERRKIAREEAAARRAARAAEKANQQR